MRPTQEIEEMHRVYCEGSGFDLQLTTPRMFAWEAWLDYGSKAKPPWGPSQMINTLAFLHQRIKSSDGYDKRKPACLRFVYLVENPANFEEELSLARKDWLRAQRLNRKPKFAPDKAAVCRATGRPDAPPEIEAKPAAAVMVDWKGLATAMRQQVTGGRPSAPETPDDRAQRVAVSKVIAEAISQKVIREPSNTPEKPHATEDPRLES